ncbi:MAG TPA: hypothetical protein VEI03_15600 [Stellaceae bacterium]|nr:hypothetical protein [Stellaceae bacterium]
MAERHRHRLAALLLALFCAAPGSAMAADAGELCGSFVRLKIELAPVIRADAGGPASDHSFACLMWQSFIYLNWPAKAPGEPDPAARFGAPGATVWETYKRHDEVFRPGAAPPAPWGVPDRSRSGPRPLSLTHQTDGETLVDRAGRPVYYEMLINRDEFNYIVANRLYDASAQLALARSDGIVLPAGPSAAYGPIGTIEIKAAWKVLSAAELAQSPRRFHTAEAVLEDGTTATVGLVGLHLNQRITGFTEGVWASFLQVDSAPVAGAEEPAQAYSFYDPSCAPCAVNARTEPPQSTQVEQVFPVAPSARAINDFVRDLIRRDDPASPWQFYELLGVQWPQFAAGLPTPVPDPQRHLRGVPLSVGTPSTSTLMNPVLETFRQSPNVSCLGCHAGGATAASDGATPLAADYSFLLGHAQKAAARE